MVVAVEREFVLPAELPVGPEATIHVYNDALQWGLPLDPSKQEEDGKPDPLDELSQVGMLNLLTPSWLTGCHRDSC
jgi:hypothetical protein